MGFGNFCAQGNFALVITKKESEKKMSRKVFLFENFAKFKYSNKKPKTKKYKSG